MCGRLAVSGWRLAVAWVSGGVEGTCVSVTTLLLYKDVLVTRAPTGHATGAATTSILTRVPTTGRTTCGGLVNSLDSANRRNILVLMGVVGTPNGNDGTGISCTLDNLARCIVTGKRRGTQLIATGTCLGTLRVIGRHRAGTFVVHRLRVLKGSRYVSMLTSCLGSRSLDNPTTHTLTSGNDRGTNRTLITTLGDHANSSGARGSIVHTVTSTQISKTRPILLMLRKTSSPGVRGRMLCTLDYIKDSGSLPILTGTTRGTNCAVRIANTGRTCVTLLGQLIRDSHSTIVGTTGGLRGTTTGTKRRRAQRTTLRVLLTTRRPTGMSGVIVTTVGSPDGGCQGTTLDCTSNFTSGRLCVRLVGVIPGTGPRLGVSVLG